MRSFLFFLVLFTSVSSFSYSKYVYLREANNTMGAELVVFDPGAHSSQVLPLGDLMAIYPTISSDGSFVAFSGSLDGDNWGIYLYDLTNQSISQIVAPDRVTMMPSFSGNGRRLAYTAPDETGKNQIFVMDLESWFKSIATQPQKIVTEAPAYYPCLSSAGFKATFHLSRADGDKRVQTIALYDLKKETFTEFVDERTSGPLKGKAPCFSFDDDRIVFAQSVTEDNWDIYSIDIDGKNLTQITNGDAKEYAPRFTPDGGILYASNVTGKFEFYKMAKGNTHARGDVSRRMLTDNVNIWDPRLSGNLGYSLELKPEILGNKRSSFAAVKHDGRLYAIAGHIGFEHTYPPESFSREVHAFDIQTQTWSQVADRLTAVHGLTGAGFGKYIYTFGGFAYSSDYSPKWKSIADIERYDTEKNVWEKIGELPEPRSSNAIAQVGSKVYLLGGWDATPQYKDDYNGTFYRSIIEFDLETETSRYLNVQMPEPARRAFTAAVRNGKIIVAGGLTQGGREFSILDEVWELDLKAETWTKLPNLPYANFAPAIQVAGENVYLFGGMKFGVDDYQYLNHVYVLKEKDWSHTGRYLRERKGFVQPVSISDSQIGLLGGHTYDGEMDGPVSTFEIFHVTR